MSAARNLRESILRTAAIARAISDTARAIKQEASTEVAAPKPDWGVTGAGGDRH